jgi:hypothetical protein
VGWIASVTGRWWWSALVAVGFAAGRSTGPDRHWSVQDGADWRALGPDAQRAYADGFLAGAGLAQALPAGAEAARRPDSTGPATPPDSAALRQTMAALSRNGRFRFPYGANVYLARVNDYYWWENHRPLPIWYAFWEVNTSLIGPTAEPAR